MKYRLSAHYDQTSENPGEWAPGRILSFNRRHSNFVDYRAYTHRDCPDCRGTGRLANDECSDCPRCEGWGEIDCTLAEHPDVIAVMSYYEHGRCKWMVGQSTVTDPGGWDTANVAGVMVWNGTDNERLAFNALSSQEQDYMLDMVAEEYTSWVNGDVYGYRLVELDQCAACGHISEGREIDSLWGHIGDQFFSDTISDAIHGFQIDPADVEITGEAAYIVEIRSEA